MTKKQKINESIAILNSTKRLVQKVMTEYLTKKDNLLLAKNQNQICGAIDLLIIEIKGSAK
jgi:hypothetical protein